MNNLPQLRRAYRLLCSCMAAGSLLLPAITAAEPAIDHNPAKLSLPKKIVFSCPLPADSDSEIVLAGLYQRVFDNLQIEFEMQPLPALRESAELDKGTVDGTCGRSNSPQLNNNPHYVRLAKPITYFSLHFFATRPMTNITSLADLPDGSRVIYTSGTFAIEKQLKAIPHIELISASNQESAFRMLAADRADFFVTGHQRPRQLQDESNVRYRHPGIHRDFYALFTWDYQGLYPFIHVRHLQLKAALEAEIERQLQRYPDEQLALPPAP